LFCVIFEETVHIGCVQYVRVFPLHNMPRHTRNPELIAEINRRISGDICYLPKVAPEEHAPNICWVPSIDTLVVCWFAGQKEGLSDVGIWVSHLSRRSDENSQSHTVGNWSRPVLVNHQPGRSYQNPVLFLHPDENTLYLWHTSQTVCGRRRYKTYQLTTNDLTGATGWSPPTLLFDQPIMIKAPPLLTDDSIILPVYYKGRVDYPALKIRERLGAQWKEISISNSERAVQPYLIRHIPPSRNRRPKENPSSYLIFYRDRDAESIYFDQGDDVEHFRNPMRLDIPNNDCGISALSLNDGRIMLIANNTNDRRVRTPLSVFVGSFEGFEMTVTLECESIAGHPVEYSYPNAVQTPDGIVHIVYTYGRETIKYVRLAEHPKNKQWMILH